MLFRSVLVTDDDAAFPPSVLPFPHHAVARRPSLSHSSSLLSVHSQAPVILVQGLDSDSHPQPETQDKILQTVSRDHDDVILAPDGHNAHFIDAVTDISDEIACDHHLEENLLEIEDQEAAALKLLIQEEDDLYNLETDLYMLSRPVCLCAETPELLEKALRIYCGLAIYDGTWEQDPALVKYFSEKYGMICL